MEERCFMHEAHVSDSRSSGVHLRFAHRHLPIYIHTYIHTYIHACIHTYKIWMHCMHNAPFHLRLAQGFLSLTSRLPHASATSSTAYACFSARPERSSSCSVMPFVPMVNNAVPACMYVYMHVCMYDAYCGTTKQYPHVFMYACTHAWCASRAA
jgi:hypothetical protein